MDAAARTAPDRQRSMICQRLHHQAFVAKKLEEMQRIQEDSHLANAKVLFVEFLLGRMFFA